MTGIATKNFLLVPNKMKIILIVIMMIALLGIILFISNKSGKNCNFVASYEATKNPLDSDIKQKNIYDAYFEICNSPTFNYEIWKLENKIPKN